MDTLEDKISRLDLNRLPRHVAMIMDGNGRWARARGRERSEGHYEGIRSVRLATELSSDLGIGYLTLYTFSTENWNRPKEEVDTLMYLIGMAIRRETPDLIANNVRLNLIGDLSRVPDEAMAYLRESLEATAACTGLTLTLAISYSGRSEITRAVRNLASKAAKGELSPDSIDEKSIEGELYTHGLPDPDLLIRTGGEMRISNFLLWQCAYSELYFTPILWPDFGKEAYADALLEYQGRERRYGKTGEQVRQEAEENNEPK